MIYLAILLILTGLLIVLLAFFIEIRKVREPESEKKGQSEVPEETADSIRYSDDSGIIFPETEELSGPDGADDSGCYDWSGGDEEDIFISFGDHDGEPADAGEPGHYEPVPEIYDNPEDARSSRNVSETENHNGNRAFSVLYDDRSNIIDYDSGAGVIDSTLAGYKRIKRTGRGILDLDNDGLNFHIDDKLYRFDFHSIHDLWSGSNYIALPLKGSGSVKLFLIEGNSGLPGKAEICYSEYLKG